MFEGFGFAGTLERISDDRLYNIENAQSDAAVLPDPIAKILQKARLKDGLATLLALRLSSLSQGLSRAEACQRSSA